MSERVLVVGGGGREHSLATYISRSPEVSEVFCAPGNGGTNEVAVNLPFAETDVHELVKFCNREDIGLSVIGPDAALEAGVSDALRAVGVPTFGPSRLAARLEWDKIFASNFMMKQGIPTPSAKSFDDFGAASKYLSGADPESIVIKANGLAAGKGVVLPKTKTQAINEARNMMLNAKFGAAGETIQVQERLKGKEVSVLALCYGAQYTILPICQDYKRLLDNDQGPNTGGMGAVAPAEIVNDSELEEVRYKIIEPTLQGMLDGGCPYKGVLYLGLMMTSEGPQVIEFNARFGDPECQAILPLINEDVFLLIKDAAEGNVRAPKIKEIASALIVLASEGYPENPTVPRVISGLGSQYKNVEVFHAGTSHQSELVMSAGGRVLNVVGLGENIDTALVNAYAAIGDQAINFEGVQYRKDIGSNLY